MKETVNYITLFFFISLIIVAIAFFTLKDADLAAAQELPVEETIPEVKEPTYVLTYEVTEKTTYLGEFKLTAYCSCDKCCGEYANNRPVDENGQEIVIGSVGNVLKPHHSIAVDPTVIPYGTTVVINGEEYVAEDCGGAIKDNRIDVYFNDHNEALEFGIQIANVYVKEIY